MFGTPTTSTPIATDTIVPKFPYYFRATPENKYEMNERINSKVQGDQWVEIPKRAQQVLNENEGDLQVGQLVVFYTSEARAADAWMNRNDTIHRQANEAIGIIGERLLEEAEKRGWCSEFDEIIDEVNAKLPAPFQLPVRERDFNVSWTETYTITVQRSATVTARNEDQACDLASEMYCGEADEYEMRDAISYGNYEFSDDNSDYEAEEA